LFLVSEIEEGIPFFDKLETMESFSEKQAATIIDQLLKALNFCHQNDIMYRDFHPSDILFKQEGEDCSLKIIDLAISVDYMNKNE
jgi:calcium-dependent protein kinase